jgi:hypothetical protein
MADIFDTVAAGQTPQQATSQPSGSVPAPQGDIFDQVASSQTQAPTSAASQATPTTPFESRVTGISAAPQPTTTMGKLAQWVDNVTLDLKDGGDRTGVGTVMQKLGAHGIDSGNSEAVGDFMASLPLGLLKAGKGAAEVVPSQVGGEKGNTWKGVKDLVGGGLQALSMPSAFAGPEASAFSDEGLLSDAANVAGKVTSKITAPLSSAVQSAKSVFTNIPKQTESQLVETVGDAAEHAGLDRPTTNTFQGSVTDLANQFKQRAQSAYQALDDAAPGFQEARDKIAQLTKAYKTQLNLDPSKADEIEGMLNTAKSTISDLLDDGQTAQWKAADQDWTRYKSLNTVLGKTAKSAEDLTNDALTNVGKLSSGVQSLQNTMKSGNPIDMLYRAFPEHAGDISNIVQQATKLTSQSQTAKTVLKWLGASAATAVGGGALYEAGKNVSQ